MNEKITILMFSAASLGFIHTIIGPDHYIPFIAMAKARNWSYIRTLWITLLCGIGHIGSTIILGLIGVLLGKGLNEINFIESIRGNIAAGMLILFGLAYMIWGVYRVIQNKPHKHFHIHGEGVVHEHEHTHHSEHDHIHKKEKVVGYTPWILFIIFAFGPCEFLIPYLTYFSTEEDTLGIISVIVVFSVATIVTMLLIVMLFTFGLKKLPSGKLEKYTHIIAGATILLSGCAIMFLGL